MSEVEVELEAELESVPIVEYEYEEGDHDKFAHYAQKDQITEALVNGLPIVALCGKIWVPSRDPDNFPICPRCAELYKTLFLS